MGFNLSPALHQSSARSAFRLKLNPCTYLSLYKHGATDMLRTIKGRIVIERYTPTHTDIGWDGSFALL